MVLDRLWCVRGGVVRAAPGRHLRVQDGWLADVDSVPARGRRGRLCGGRWRAAVYVSAGASVGRWRVPWLTRYRPIHTLHRMPNGSLAPPHGIVSTDARAGGLGRPVGRSLRG